MKKSNILFFVISFLFSIIVNGSSSTLTSFDKRLYNLEKSGISDLKFTAKVSGLTKKVQEQIPTAKIKEVYFEVYTIPKYKKFYVEVIGLPPSFDKQKQYLEGLIKPYLEYVSPSPFLEKLDGYEIVEKSEGDALKVVAEDKSYKKAITKIEFLFSDGELLNITSQSSQGKTSVDYRFQELSGANNQLILKKVTQELQAAGVQKSSLTLLEYEKVEGFTLPSSIEVTESQKIATGNEKEDNQVINSELRVNFSNYKVNQGEAVKYLAKRKD